MLLFYIVYGCFVTEVPHSCCSSGEAVNVLYVVVCDRCCCLWQRYYIPAAWQMEPLIYCMLLFVTDVLHSCRPADGAVNILYVVIFDRGTTFLLPSKLSDYYIVCCCLWQILLFVTKVLHSCRPADGAVDIYCMLLFVTEVLHSCCPAN